MKKEEKTPEQLTQDIATTIERLSSEVSKLLGGRLNRSAILTLLAHSTKMTKTQVNKVLESLVEMKKDYLTK